MTGDPVRDENVDTDTDAHKRGVHVKMEAVMERQVHKPRGPWSSPGAGRGPPSHTFYFCSPELE